MIPRTRWAGLLAGAATVIAIAALAAALSIRASSSAAFDGPVLAVVDIDERHQRIDGFGTALAWWLEEPYDSNDWRDMYYRHMGCSMLRMEMHITALSANRARRPTDEQLSRPVHLGPDTYENIEKFNFRAWGVANAGAMARASIERRLEEDFKFIGALWTPPHWMKGPERNWRTGEVVNPDKPTWHPQFSSNSQGGTLIDTPENLEQFGRYVAAYVKGMEREWGVPFYAISIQNELTFSQWFNSCVYTLEVYPKAVRAVRAAFDAHNQMYPDDPILTKLKGPEEVGFGAPDNPWILWRQMMFIDAVRSDPEADAAMDIYAIHGYMTRGAISAGPHVWGEYWRGRPRGNPQWRGIAGDGRQSWVTEMSGQNHRWISTNDLGEPNGALGLAMQIHDALVHGNVAAYVYWQMSDTADPNPPPGIEVLVSGTNYAGSKKYQAARHFFRHIRPGAVRVTVGGNEERSVRISAFLHEEHRTLTMVLINLSEEPQPVEIDLRSLEGRYVIGPLAGWRTSQEESFAEIEAIAVEEGRGVVEVAGQSVLTLVSGLSPPEAAN